jgi:hypothetical protein
MARRKTTTNDLKLEKVVQTHRTTRWLIVGICATVAFWKLCDAFVAILDDEPRAIAVKAFAAIIFSLIVPASGFAIVQLIIRYVNRTKYGRTAILEAELDRNRTSSRMNEEGTQVLTETDERSGGQA